MCVRVLGFCAGELDPKRVAVDVVRIEFQPRAQTSNLTSAYRGLAARAWPVGIPAPWFWPRAAPDRHDDGHDDGHDEGRGPRTTSGDK